MGEYGMDSLLMSEDYLEEAEENGEMDTWEAAFYRGFDGYDDEEPDWAEEEM